MTAPRAFRLRSWLIAAAALAAGGGWWAWHHHVGTASADTAAAAASAAGSGPGGPGDRGRRNGPGGPRSGGPGRIQPVSVAHVERRDIRINVQAIGTIAAANIAVVKAKVEAELKAIHFKEGQVVKAGTLLAELDNRAFQIAVAQAEGQLARDQAQLRNAQVDLARFRDLLAKDGIAKQQVDTQEALVRQLQGTVQISQAACDNARLQLSYTRIVAPITGRVGLKQADLGNVVKPGDAAGLLSIAQTQPVNVVFAVPDLHLGTITAQLKQGKPLKVEAWDRELKHALATGQVASTDNAIDSATGTIKLKAAFPNADGSLFPNQFVNVKLQLGSVAQSLAVPSAAVLRNGEGSFVYAVGDDKTVSVKPVQVGAVDGDWVSVQGALQPGDAVVIDGTDRIRDGAQVNVIKPATGGAEEGRGRRRRDGGAVAGPGASAPDSSAPQSHTQAPSAPDTHRSPAADAGTTAERGAGAGRPEGDAPRGDFLSRLPPEVAEKVKAMSPEERRAWFEQRRAERARRDGGN